MIDAAKKLNILFLASWYPNRLEPQNGNFIQRHAVAVSKKCNVAVLHVLSIQGMKGFDIDAKWVNNVYEVIVYFEKTSNFFPLRKIRNYLKAHKKGYERILEVFKKIDLVHLNVFWRAGLFALHLKNKKNIPYIITEHWTGFLKINPYKFNPFEKHFIQKIGNSAAAICPVSEDLKNAIEEFGIQGQFQVIPNVVDTKLFHITQHHQTQNLQSDFVKILHVSTLVDKHKNVTGLLNVIAKLQKGHSRFKVTLAGNKVGDFHYKNLERLKINPGLVEIKEEIPLDDIAQLMREHQIFVLFSNYENLPCVISEAHASGMVVIATDVGGVREMIDKKNGVLINAKDEDALFQALKNTIDQLPHFDPFAISSKAVKRYSYESVADQYFKIYSTVLNAAK